MLDLTTALARLDGEAAPDGVGSCEGMSFIKCNGSIDHSEDEGGGYEASTSCDERRRTGVPSGTSVRASSSNEVKYLLYGDSGVPVDILYWCMIRQEEW